MSVSSLNEGLNHLSFTDRASDYLKKLAHACIANLKHDVWLYVFMAGYFTLGYILLNQYGQAEKSHFFFYYKVLFPLLTIIFIPFFVILTILTVYKRVKKRADLGMKMVAKPSSIARHITGVAFLAAYCLFIAMFTAIKTGLGRVLGFKYDVVQADIDKALFFGNDAWRVLFEPIHSTWLQIIIEFNYNVIWHLHVYIALYLVATAFVSREFRTRYLFSFMLVWIVVGNLFAGIFISAGPVYYGFVTGDEARFAGQLEILAAHANSGAVNFQAYLWNAYINDTPGFGTGISAFPSVHVSLCVLNTFFAFEFSKRIGFVSLAYTIFITISSVFLAWHYFIDGLFGGVLVAIIYYSTKYISQKIHNSRSTHKKIKAS